MTQINQYSLEVTSLVNESFLDVDHWNGSGFESAKISWQNFLDTIETQISLPGTTTIYTGNSTLTSDREVAMSTFNLGFTGTGNIGINIAGPSATEKLHVDGTVRMNNLKSGTASFLTPNIVNELAGRTRIANGLHVGSSTNLEYNQDGLFIEAEAGENYITLEGAGTNRATISVKDFTTPATLKELGISATNIVPNTAANMSLGTGAAPPVGFKLYTDGGKFKADSILSSDTKDTFIHGNIENEFDARTRIADGLHIGASTLVGANDKPLSVQTGASYITFESIDALTAGIKVNNTLFNSTFQRDLQISKKKLIFDVPDATSGSGNIENIIELQTSNWNPNTLAADRPTIFFKASGNVEIGNPSISNAIFRVSNSDNPSVQNDLIHIDTSKNWVSYGSRNSISTTNNSYLIGTANNSDGGNGGVNHFLFGVLLRASGSNAMVTGSGYSGFHEVRSNIRSHLFNASTALRRINFEYGLNLPLKLSPAKASNTGVISDNQGVELVSSYWDGAASQDIRGYINHFITDQAAGQAALSLGNQSNNRSFVMDSNNAIRLNEQQHGITVSTPTQDALRIYPTSNATFAPSIRLINPNSDRYSLIQIQGDAAARLTLQTNGTTHPALPNTSQIAHFGVSSDFIIRSTGSGDCDLDIISESGFLTLTATKPIVAGALTTANTDSVVEIISLTKGVRFPIFTTADRDANIASPQEGLIIYNTTTKKLNLHDGTAWVEV